MPSVRASCCPLSSRSGSRALATPRMHVRLACWLTSLFVTSSLHVQIARQINKTHGERIATSQHGILNKIDSTLEKELLHSITKGEEW